MCYTKVTSPDRGGILDGQERMVRNWESVLRIENLESNIEAVIDVALRKLLQPGKNRADRIQRVLN